MMNRRAAKFLLLQSLIACVLLTAAAAVRAQFQIESWTTDNGLPQNTVHSIVQTPDGYLWLATLDGLVRYDGVKFTVFNKNNTKGIESNRFTQLLVGAGGDLWVGTEESGITRYRNGAFQTFSATGGAAQTQPIWSIILNPAGEPVAATENGFVRWDGEKFAPVAVAADDNENSIVFWSKSGAVFFSQGKTLRRAENNRESVFVLPIASSAAIINRLVEDRRGRIWVGTNKFGLFVLENERLTAYTGARGASGYEVMPLIEDEAGNLWGGSDTGAVVFGAGGEEDLIDTADGLSGNIITSVIEDREGNFWIGTLKSGLNRLSRQSVAFYGKAQGLAGDTVHTAFQSGNGDIWIGGESLTRRRDGRLSTIGGREKLSKPVTAIAEDRSGRMWFGNWEGAYYLENGKFTDFSQNFGIKTSVMDIHEDRGGALWFGTGKGVFRWFDNRMTGFTTADGLASDNVKVFLESNGGALWIGTYGGLSRYENGVFTSFTANDGLAGNLVRSLYEDADGTLWIGTYDSGLSRFKDGRFTRYTSNDGLFNDGVFQILEDASGKLWMSSNRGVYTVSKRQLNDFADGVTNRVESIAYGKADGLLETECNGGQQPAGMKDRNGNLWFPTQSGVAVIDPARVKINRTPPPVLIESVALNGVAANPSDGVLKIEPSVENVEISYTGLSFVKPELVRFRYKMDGLDSDWVEAGTRRSAYYAHLPPGEYTFTVVAANADGVWNATGKSLAVRVAAPFYRTRWFLIGSLFSAGAAAFLFYRGRVAKLEKRQSAQQEFSRRLLASQEKERQRIAAELHDSIGQSLLIIKNRAYLALTDLDEPEAVREQLEELSDSATEAIEECREISYNLRPYQIERFGLTKTLEAIFRRVSEVMPIETVVELDSVDGVFSAEAETNIYRVVQEAVNNIIKHSEASFARLKIQRRAATIEITVRDDGRGFDKTAANGNGSGRGGFGLIGISERARMLGGSYEIETAPGRGTSITIKLIISPANERN